MHRVAIAILQLLKSRVHLGLLMLGGVMGISLLLLQYFGYSHLWIFLDNIALSVLAYALTLLLRVLLEQRVSFILSILVFVLWLAAMPNVAYPLTDYLHLGKTLMKYDMLELLVIVCGAFIGIVLSSLLLHHVYQMARGRQFSPFAGGVIVYGVSLLEALGLYIGRVVRLNSWDLFTRPAESLWWLNKLLLHPSLFPENIAIVFCYSLFLCGVYFLFPKGKT